MIKKILSTLLLLTVATWAANSQQRSFIWADDENYWPVIYRGKDGKPAGAFNDILTEAFKRLDIPLQKAVYPWKRAQSMVMHGEADGMVTVYTKKRQAYTVASKPIWHIGETLFFRRDNPKACKMLKINSFNDMRDLKVVDIMGSGWTQEKYKKYGIDNVIWVPTVDSAMNMLAKGRADVFIMFNLNAYNILSKKRATEGPLSKGYQNITAISPTFASLPFHLLIRKGSPFVKKIDDLNKVLEEMKKDGTYQRIKLKYTGISPVL